MELNLIEILCENTNTSLYIKEGTTLYQLLEQVAFQDKSTYVAAFVDNKIKELGYRIFSSKSIRFVPIGSTNGIRVYARSLSFLIQKAVHDLYPEMGIRMMHPVGQGGFYAESESGEPFTEQHVVAIKQRAIQLIEQDIPIVRRKLSLEDAKSLYRKFNYADKLLMLETRPQFFVSIFNLAGIPGYFYGAMVPSTGYLKCFDIVPFGDGIIILMPWRDNPTEVESMCIQPKLFDVFSQNKQWSEILKVANVGSLNTLVLDGQASDLIKVGEALQEKNFATAADRVIEQHRNHGVKMVLIAGPSSSGKTTFAKRLSIQLRVLGLEPRMISLDNYFVNRELTPRDEHGEYDFESLDALDVAEFNRDLLRLFAGERVELPKFNFQSGTRFFDGETMQLSDRSILIVEGIHALNPALTPDIDDHYKFKIYASALTTLAIDNMTVVHTTDNRLLRRIVRDNKYRGRSAYETLRGWSSVRRGEDKHIFPYQEQADMMFNTSLFFELPILKHHALPLLNSVPANAIEYSEALRLIHFLGCFVEIPDKELPPTSLLREFLGGSSFIY